MWKRYSDISHLKSVRSGFSAGLDRQLVLPLVERPHVSRIPIISNMKRADSARSSYFFLLGTYTWQFRVPDRKMMDNDKSMVLPPRVARRVTNNPVRSEKVQNLWL